MDSTLRFIGEIHSSLKKIEDCPLQESENAPQAELRIYPDFVSGIDNIESNVFHEIIMMLQRSASSQQDLLTDQIQLEFIQ